MNKYPRRWVGATAAGKDSYCYAGPNCSRHPAQSPAEAFNKRVEGLSPQPAESPADGRLQPATVKRTGINKLGDDRLMKLTLEGSVWWQSLTDDEERAIENYRHMGFDMINYELRETSGTPTSDRSKKLVSLIDSAISKAAPRDEEVLYRLYKVPGAERRANNKVKIDAYVDETFKVGSTMKWDAYLSTTADADFVAQKGSEDTRVIVFEIVSKRGAVLHREPKKNHGWSILDDEKEVLLPRGSSMRVVKILKDVSYQQSCKPQYTGSPFYKSTKAKAKLTVIQMVDES